MTSNFEVLVRSVLRKLRHPSTIPTFVRHKMRSGEYIYFDFVDFLPQLAAWVDAVTPRRLRFEDPIFVIGIRRSGTTLLYRILGGHPDVYLFFERFPGDRYRRLLGEHDRNIWSMRDPEAFKRVTAEYLGPHLKLRALRWGAKLPIVFRKRPGSLSREGLESLVRAFPRAQFVGIIRDPYVCIDSNVRREGLEVEHWIDDYRAMVELFGELQLRDDVSFRSVRYEDLVTDTTSLVSDLLGWLKLPESADVLNSSDWSRRGPSDYSQRTIDGSRARPSLDLDEAQVDRITARVFPAAGAFGYATRERG